MLRQSTSSISILFLLLLANASFADVVSQTFTGTITVVNSGGQTGTPIPSVDGISVGSTFTATFSYQTNNAGPDADPSAAQGLLTITPSAETTLTINVGGRVFQKSSTGNLGVQTFNNVVSTLSNNTDVLSLFAPSPLLPTGWSVTNANSVSTRLSFLDASGAAITSDALPNTFSSNWNIGQFSESFAASVTTPTGVINQLYIEGNLNFSPVPEPSTIAMVSLAAVAVCAFRYQRRKSTASC